jgi:hypothetical protein
MQERAPCYRQKARHDSSVEVAPIVGWCGGIPALFIVPLHIFLDHPNLSLLGCSCDAIFGKYGCNKGDRECKPLQKFATVPSNLWWLCALKVGIRQAEVKLHSASQSRVWHPGPEAHIVNTGKVDCFVYERGTSKLIVFYPRYQAIIFGIQSSARWSGHSISGL